ncbi:unnamed protein product [Orchesella dallaii]|uniref:CCHC-type domain-containing protein n=1 Tax=Orchesella dallaii TaxID=48710 RepID=A0ABP1R2G6_9HEXA
MGDYPKCMKCNLLGHRGRDCTISRETANWIRWNIVYPPGSPQRQRRIDRVNAFFQKQRQRQQERAEAHQAAAVQPGPVNPQSQSTERVKSWREVAAFRNRQAVIAHEAYFKQQQLQTGPGTVKQGSLKTNQSKQEETGPGVVNQRFT